MTHRPAPPADLSREAQITSLAVDKPAHQRATRRARAALASATPVDRGWGVEVLSFAQNAVDFRRAPLPLLWGHDQGQIPIGRVDDLQIEGDRVLRGTLEFADTPRADEVWSAVTSELVRGVSIGYHVKRWETGESGEYIAAEWEPAEVSIVSVPADPTVGIHRSQESTMSKPDGTPVPQRDGATVVPLELERERIRAIRDHTRRAATLRVPEVDALEDRAIADGWTAERYGAELLGRVPPTTPVAGPGRDPAGARNPYDQAGEDAVEKFHRGAEEALAFRCNLLTPDEAKAARANPFRTWSLRELAVEYFRVAENRRPADVASEVFKRSPVIAHSPGDFPSILANVAGKSLRQAYEENTGSLAWCATVDVPDFKSNYLVQLGAFSDLELVPASGQVPQGTIGDKHELVQAATYGRLLTLSRHIIVNDDTNAISRLPAALGAAAAREVADLVYAKLTGGHNAVTMTEDATYLFHANHTNYIASGGAGAGTVSATTLGAARKALAAQKAHGSTTAFLNLRPAWLLVPEALWPTAMDYAINEYDPAGTAGTLKRNPYNGMLTVVSDPRLDANSITKWYLAASAGQIDTVVIAYVGGRREPQLVQEDGIGQDGTVYRVLMDVGVGVGDFRGLYLNWGA